jgi:hypothetical protein
LGRPLNDNIENWKVSHFEAKDHTFQTQGVRFWCVEFFVIKFSKNPMTQNLDDFIYVVILPNFWQALAQTTDHLQKWPTHVWRALFILYTPDILRFGLNVLKIKFFDIEFHFYFPPSRFLNWHIVLADFLQWIPCVMGHPVVCTICFRTPLYQMFWDILYYLFMVYDVEKWCSLLRKKLYQYYQSSTQKEPLARFCK